MQEEKIKGNKQIKPILNNLLKERNAFFTHLSTHHTEPIITSQYYNYQAGLPTYHIGYQTWLKTVLAPPYHINRNHRSLTLLL